VLSAVQTMRLCFHIPWWESLKERDHSEDKGVDGRMGLEWILGRLAGGCGVDSVGSA
jgi:hypothetical protein